MTDETRQSPTKTVSQAPTLWAPWHPKHGFMDNFMPATWISHDLDQIAARVKSLNRDDQSNARNGWRAVKVTLDRVPAEQLSNSHRPEFG